MPSCEENKLFVIERTMYNIYIIYMCVSLYLKLMKKMMVKIRQTVEIEIPM